MLLRKEFLTHLLQAASIQRWNDHITPKGKGFTELDKQAHKMLLAFVLARFEETDRNVKVNWRAIIEGGFFELLQRIELTDIKPPIFHQLMATRGQELNAWVFAQLERERGIHGDLLARIKQYFLDPERHAFEKRILRAAHYLATQWEFNIIYHFNPGVFGLDETKAAIENEIEEYYDLAGVQRLILGKKLYNFVNLVSQLRFQQRWSRSLRMPETSVMGHMLMVAMLCYFCSMEFEACNKRLYNNYFAGLFHDLPEVLTRDIISPVKKSIEGLEHLLKEIENRLMEDRILPLLPRPWHEEIRHLVMEPEEFQSRIRENGSVRYVTSLEINRDYNEDLYSPVDGEIVKACDEVAAYLEAFLSLSHGITSTNLVDACAALKARYVGREIAGINFGALFEEEAG